MPINRVSDSLDTLAKRKAAASVDATALARWQELATTYLILIRLANRSLWMGLKKALPSLLGKTEMLRSIDLATLTHPRFGSALQCPEVGLRQRVAPV